MHDLLVAFYFFLPAGIANMCPVLANHIPIIRNWHLPMDFGKHYQTLRIFGDSKTWRGFIFGVLLAAITGLILKSFIYQHLDWPAGLPQPGVGQGMLLGIGALTGDAMESFFKRRRGIKSGSSWYPFDQIDYIIGGLIFALLFIKPTLSLILWVGLVYFGLHLVFSYLGYLLGLKKHPL